MLTFKQIMDEHSAFFKKLVEEMMREDHLEDEKEEIEEVSTSAATPGYMTPRAFKGNPDENDCDYRARMKHE